MKIDDIKYDMFIYCIGAPHIILRVVGFAFNRQFLEVQDVYLEPPSLTPEIDYDTVGLLPVSQLEYYEVLNCM